MIWVLLAIFFCMFIAALSWTIIWVPKYYERRSNLLERIRLEYPNIYLENKAEIDILEADDDLGLLRSNVSWGRGQLVLLAFPQVTTEQGKKDLVKFKRDPAVRRYIIQTIYGPLCIVIVMFVAFHLWAHKLI